VDGHPTEIRIDLPDDDSGLVIKGDLLHHVFVPVPRGKDLDGQDRRAVIDHLGGIRLGHEFSRDIGHVDADQRILRASQAEAGLAAQDLAAGFWTTVQPILQCRADQGLDIAMKSIAGGHPSLPEFSSDQLARDPVLGDRQELLNGHELLFRWRNQRTHHSPSRSVNEQS
jgi:hypothetical protein